MQMVLPNVLDPLVYSRQLHTKFLDPFRLIISRLLPTLAELPLHPLQLVLQRPVRLDVGVFLAVTVHDQGLDAEINTDFVLALWHLFNVFLDQQRAVVLTALVLGDGAERDFFLHFTVQDNRDAFQELRHDQFVAFDPDVLRDAERLLAVLVLELRECRTFLVEVAVGGIEVLNDLLERLRTDFGEPRRCLLQLGQFFAVTDEVVAASGREVFFFASCEEVVVQAATAPKVFGEQYLLFNGWS